MNTYIEIKKEIGDKKEQLKQLLDKKTLISKKLKFFIPEILELNKICSKQEQADTFSEILNEEIKYQTYVSFYRRNILPKLSNAEELS